jgi:DNA-binding CsgD family transcriptional regulator/tetratricopeptide (TPR) repeat protein
MLVEREALLADLTDGVDDALAGRGALVFLGGEAGVGKSALVRVLAAEAARRCTVRVGGVDNVTTAAALAALVDAMPEIETLTVGDGDRIRLFRRLREELRAAPGLLVLEDLHWADGATLDALRYLGRRLDGVPVLIVGTYRDDETGPRHPVTRLLGDLAGVPGVRRVHVPPLTVEGVATLAAASGAATDPVLLHARTGGNAFFVTEVVADGGEALPATVSDAILARVARMDAAAQDVAAAAAVLGTAVDAGLLTVVSERDLGAVDGCVEAGVLVAGEAGYAFRHDLAREAVSRSLSAMQRSRLHARALAELTQRTPEDHRTLAHHAAGCGEHAVAADHAARAAERAARLGAHREAVAHYRMALGHATQAGSPAAERSDLFVALSYECYLTDQLPEAISARQRALELHELAADRSSVGDDERWLSRLSWFLGRGADAERYGAKAIATLEPLGADARLAMAYSNLAQLRMLAKDAGEAERWGERALELARSLGDLEIEVHALNNLGTSASMDGRIAEGDAMLAHSLDLALAADLHEHVARAYTNLGSIAMEQHRCAIALRRLDAGIAYCEERDLDSWTRYMLATRCLTLADVGRFDDALADAARVIGHPDTAPISAIPATAAAARVRARRGEDVRGLLEVAIGLANTTGELQRMAPAATACAEDAWLRGALETIGPATEAAWALAVAYDDPWATGELAWWRMLAGIHPPADVVVAQPFALQLAGESASAAALWEELGSTVWAAYARMLGADATDALRTFDDLGAPAVVDAIARTRRERGLPLPRRPHAATRARPGRLTERELDVLRLLDEGLSTAQIADRLVLSPRTVEHHISAVLHKLGEPTRARAVAAARRDGGPLAIV